MRCIIVDDEPIARRGMRRLVETRPDLELVAEFDSAESAREWLQSNSTDLVFLDIEMPGTSGVELARELPADILVIFTTAYSEYAIEGYDVEAIDYLLKPVRQERFNRAVDRAFTYRGLSHTPEEPPLDFIIVKADRKYMRLRLADILYVEGLKDYVIIHLASGRVVSRLTVKAMEEQLPSPAFVRISKSVIVNKDAVTAFDSRDVTIGTAELAIGASYRDAALNALMS